MTRFGRSRRLTDGPVGRIVGQLRRGPKTIDELAAELDLTRTAVRAQLTTMLADGVVEPRGTRPSGSKPARLYGITAEAEAQLSGAYIPVLTHLIAILAQRMTPEEFDRILRDVGRSLGSGRPMPRGKLRDRVNAANTVLTELGGLTEVTEEGDRFLIQGHGCPLAAATGTHPEVCNVVETFLTEMIGQPVTKCCDREGQRRCCFEVSGAA